MLPVRVSGGPGKEVPPERARTNHKKKGMVRSAAELPKENATTPPLSYLERICPCTGLNNAKLLCVAGE
jgi:hypothetical protein